MSARPRTILFIVMFALGLTGLDAARAHACSCVPPSPPLERLAAVDAVFEGYVLDAAPDPRGVTQLLIHYQVLRAWKGVHADTVVTVTTGMYDANCGIGAALHTAYLVYATTAEGQLTADACFNSHRSDQDTGDFAALGAPLEVGTEPPGSLGGSASPSSSGGSAFGCAVVGEGETAASAGSLLGLAMIGLAWRRNPSTRSRRSLAEPAR